MSSKKVYLIGLFVFLGLVPAVHAATLANSTSVRNGFSVADVNQTSRDAAEFNAFAPFQSFVDSEILAINSFTGGPGGANLQFFLLGEAAFFDGNHAPDVANNFGVLDSAGNFISLIDSASANGGFGDSIIQGENEELTFALSSPGGSNGTLFSSLDADNTDDAPHIVAQRVVKDGVVVIDNPDLQGLVAAVTFNLLAGDYILYLEDLILGNNTLFTELGTSDFDYNDMIIVVRSTQVPEPATLTLLGLGLGGFGAMRRRKKIA